MANRLASEKSPYLLQHADNPVDWWAWGDPAFTAAREQGKPIFLSVGYSTCHWCHVMAHESFEDSAVAEVLNRHFISIKVDREERPDVDRVYMTYVQARTGHGGWPMSVWLLPDLVPFFGGTYFPPQDMEGRPGFTTVLNAIIHHWENDRERLAADGAQVLAHLRSAQASSNGGDTNSASLSFEQKAVTALERCFHHFYETFDPAQGGFGGAPKFPRSPGLTFLFRVAAMQGLASEVGNEAAKMAATTLRKMAEGGIHDHVGGGFHRYSVDDLWLVPHFEKMLYDQAQLAINYLDARKATGVEAFAWVARGIFEYVARELTHPDGGFFSAEDADSLEHADGGHEKKEGAYYLWTEREIDEALGEAAGLFKSHFGVRPEGNVRGDHDPRGEFAGRNILHQSRSIVETARAYGVEVENVNERLSAGLERLRTLRSRRPRPHLDDKIILAWNGLMISAFCRGAQVLGDSGYEEVAGKAAGFVRRELYDAETGTLYRSYRQGRGQVHGFAEDYACLIQALLDLYETTFSLEWLKWADRLQERMDELFWDVGDGAYQQAPKKAESLVLRVRDDYDGAEPTANSVAVLNLWRLSGLVPKGERWRKRAEEIWRGFSGRWFQLPHAMPMMVSAGEYALLPPRQLVLIGGPGNGQLRAMARVYHESLGRACALIVVDGEETRAWFSRVDEGVAGMQSQAGAVTAYFCENFSCKAPVTTVAELQKLLN